MSIEANDVTMSFAGSGIVTTNITTVTVSAAAGPSLFDIGLVGAAMGAVLHQATNPPQTPQTPAAQQAPKRTALRYPHIPKGRCRCQRPRHRERRMQQTQLVMVRRLGGLTKLKQTGYGITRRRVFSTMILVTSTTARRVPCLVFRRGRLRRARSLLDSSSRHWPS